MDRRSPHGLPHRTAVRRTAVMHAALALCVLAVLALGVRPAPHWVRTAATSPAGACTTAALVAINGSDENLYRWTSPTPGTADFSAAAAVGKGWQAIRLLSADSTSGDLFAVDTSGNLRRYTFNGTGYTGGAVVSTGWGGVDQLVGAGNGVLFARHSDGALRWYRWLSLGGRGNGWAAGSGTMVGTGWGGFTKLVGGGNGIVYGVQSGTGALLWYRDRNPLDPTGGWDGPHTVGGGWGDFTQVTSVGGGHLYATTPGGQLVHYRNLGYLTGLDTWDDPHGNEVGSGWTSAWHALTAGPATCGRLDPPVNLRAFPGGDGIALRWNPPAGASPQSYTVYRDAVAIATVPAAPTSAYVDTARYVDSAVSAGQAHTYQVSMTTTAGAVTAGGEVVGATLPANTTAPPSVTVTSQFSGTSAQEAAIKQILHDWYPKFAYVLAGSGYAPPHAITVVIGQNADNAPGVTSGSQITLDWDSPGANVKDWNTEPDFIGLVMHEATHVIQQYTNAPGWIAEGLAVWATHNILNDADTPYPSGGSYTDGYDHGAYLIRCAASWYARPNLPGDLNRTAHAGTYSDAFFSTQTGHSPSSIWTTATSPRAIP